MKYLIFILLISIQSKSETQVSLLGLTVHSAQPDQQAINLMNNKIDSAGIFALNPQINIMFIKNNEFFHVGFLSDCFSHGAGFVAYGKRYEVRKDLYLGYELGIYARQVPLDNDKPLNKMNRVGIYQVFPTPAFIAQYKLTDRIFLRAQSNLLINFFDVALEF